MHRRAVPLVLVAALTLAACGGGGKKAGKDRAQTVPSVTVTSLAPTTTAPPAAPVSPLTGLPIADQAKASRPALIVKIDNAPQALPQIGIVEADVVEEEMVEGGITRLAAIYQSTDADPVGPVRSARTTDVNIASELNHPLYAYSGGNNIFLAAIHAAPLFDVGVDRFDTLYRRDKTRPAPHNLFSNTSQLYTKTPAESKTPAALFQYRDKAGPPAGAGIAPATHLAVNFPGGLTSAVWDFDAASGKWKRTQNGRADKDLAGRQVAEDNVLVRMVPYHNVPGIKDPAGAPVPEAGLLGSGEAWLLTGNTVVKGTWTKPSATAVTTFVDAAGQPFKLTPGHTWVELAPPGSATVS